MHPPALLFANPDFFSEYARALNYLATDFLPRLDSAFFEVAEQRLIYTTYDKKMKLEHEQILLKAIAETHREVKDRLIARSISLAPELVNELTEIYRSAFSKEQDLLNQQTRHWEDKYTGPKIEILTSEKKVNIASWEAFLRQQHLEAGKYLDQATDLKILIRLYSNREGPGGSRGVIGRFNTAAVDCFTKAHESIHKLRQNIWYDSEKGYLNCGCFFPFMYENLEMEERQIACRDTFGIVYSDVEGAIGSLGRWLKDVAPHFHGLFNEESAEKLLRWLSENKSKKKDWVTAFQGLETLIDGFTKTVSPRIISPRTVSSRKESDGLRHRKRSQSTPFLKKPIKSPLSHSTPSPEEEKNGIYSSYLIGEFSQLEKMILDSKRLNTALNYRLQADEPSTERKFLLIELDKWGSLFEKIKDVVAREIQSLQ